MYEHDSNKARVTYQDVAAYFSEEEWTLLHDWQKELYSKVMNEVHQALISLGPLIVTTVYTLKTKEMNDGCTMDHQDSDTKGSIGDQADVTPITKLRIKEAVETCFMDSRSSPTTEMLNSFEGEEDATPIVTFRIKEEVETFSVCSQDSDRMENVNSSEEADSETKPVGVGLTAASCVPRRTSFSLKESGTVNMPQNRSESVKCPEWTPSCKASSRKNYVLPVSEKPMQSGSEMWSEDYRGLGEVEATQREISFGNPSDSNLNKKTPVLESTGPYKAYTIDKVSTKRITYPHQNLPACPRQKCTADMLPGYKKSINQKTIYVGQQVRRTEDNNFKCANCEKSFRWKSHLIRHYATHRDDKPFQCTVCQKRFTRSDSLITHHRTHTEERPFQCTVCMKNFKHNRNLISHMAMHMGN